MRVFEEYADYPLMTDDTGLKIVRELGRITGGGAAEDAEAWAVGTRDGEPVPSTDPAYHNSSLYHAQAAEEAASKYPRINSSGHWEVYNPSTEQWTDTGIDATGPQGQTGATPNLQIGTVQTGAAGSSASASITGTAENPYLNMSIPKGDKGDTGNTGATGATGATPDIQIGVVQTGAAGSSASASMTGTPEQPVLNMTIPKGDKGDTGNTGATPDFQIGTVTTGAAGSQASASITGTPEQPVLNMTIPKGDKGDTGDSGVYYGTQTPTNPEVEVWIDPSGTGNIPAVIDDTAGNGDTTKTWSADKIHDTFASKADVVCDTLSNQSTATFPDGADGLPMELTVGIEPVQDLHGYDNPWPAGGGKNLLPMTVEGIKGANTSGTWSGNVYTKNNVTFTILTDNAGNIIGINVNASTAASADTLFVLASVATLSNGTYAFNGCPSGGSASGYYLQVVKSPAPSIIDTGSGNTFEQGNAGYTVSNLRIVIMKGTTVSNIVFYPMVRLSSVTDATFAPYSNICPITGWTGAKISASGKNLFDDSSFAEYKQSDGTYVGTLGEFNLASVSSPTNTLLKKYVGQTAIFSFEVVSNQNGREIFAAYKSNGTATNGTSTTSTGRLSVRFNITSAFENVVIRFASGSTSEVTIKNLQVEISDTLTDYDPFGIVYPITFPNEAGTVYGGMLTVNEDGSGVLTVTDVNIASYNGESLPGEWISDRDVYASGTTPTTGAQVVYKLATPVTYTLTASQIKTLLGHNNVWADTGDVKSIIYPADTKLYIDKKFTELQALITGNS